MYMYIVTFSAISIITVLFLSVLSPSFQRSVMYAPLIHVIIMGNVLRVKMGRFSPVHALADSPEDAANVSN